MDEKVDLETKAFPDQKAELTTAYEGRGLTVTVNGADLRRDLQREARERGIPETVISENLVATRFLFYQDESAPSSHFESAEDREIAEDFDDWLSRKSEPDYEPREIIGVEPKDDGQILFHLSLRRIMDRFDEAGIPYLKVPKHAPEEVKRMAVKQGLDLVWRHEREHFMQLLMPEKKKTIERGVKIGKAIHRVAVASMVAPIPLFWVSTIAKTPEKMKLPLMISSLAMFAVGKLTADLNIKRHEHWTRTEREAQKQHRPEHWRGASPFEVSFEE